MNQIKTNNNSMGKAVKDNEEKLTCKLRKTDKITRCQHPGSTW